MTRRCRHDAQADASGRRDAWPSPRGPRRGCDIVILGLSITSSWGNGHATTYRGLVRELARRGHDVLFLERDVPWYADNRDLPAPALRAAPSSIASLDELKRPLRRDGPATPTS